MTRGQWLIVVGFLGCVLGCTQDSPDPPPGTAGKPPPASVPAPSEVLVERDLVFARPGGVELKVDVARPANSEDGPFPAVVCIHGGGWVRGDRRQLTATLEALARQGYVAIAPDYRLAPAHRFPAPFDDCRAAVRWLRENAPRFHVDPDRIGVMGLAAGGHLACLVGVAGKGEERVQAVVSFFGPTDLTAPIWDREAREKNLIPLLGGTPEQVPDAYRRASPVLYPVQEAPPFLFLHGAIDRIVPPEQSLALADRLKQAGRKAEVVLLPEQGHGWAGPELRRSIAHMIVFFDRNLQ